MNDTLTTYILQVQYRRYFETSKMPFGHLRQMKTYFSECFESVDSDSGRVIQKSSLRPRHGAVTKNMDHGMEPFHTAYSPVLVHVPTTSNRSA